MKRSPSTDSTVHPHEPLVGSWRFCTTHPAWEVRLPRRHHSQMGRSRMPTTGHDNLLDRGSWIRNVASSKDHTEEEAYRDIDTREGALEH